MKLQQKYSNYDFLTLHVLATTATGSLTRTPGTYRTQTVLIMNAKYTRTWHLLQLGVPGGPHTIYGRFNARHARPRLCDLWRQLLHLLILKQIITFDLTFIGTIWQTGIVYLTMKYLISSLRPCCSSITVSSYLQPLRTLSIIFLTALSLAGFFKYCYSRSELLLVYANSSVSFKIISDDLK